MESASGPASRAARRASLLIVDDEPSLLAVIARYLRREGFSVSTAGTAAEALALLDGQKCDVMLCDVGLPDMDAVDLVRAAHQRAPGMPVLMFSGRLDAGVADALLQAGASAYITKPLPLRDLRDIVEKAASDRTGPVRSLTEPFPSSSLLP